MDEQTKNSFSLDWRWIVAGYCYLVMFHLLPTYLMSGLTGVIVGPHALGAISGGSALNPSDVMMIWLLGGVAVVAFVVGWKSRGFTIIEPAISGALYAVTSALAFHELASVRVRDRATLAIVFWLLIVVILCTASAWVGEELKKRRVAKHVGSGAPAAGG